MMIIKMIKILLEVKAVGKIKFFKIQKYPLYKNSYK